jgi:hypothetical protein
MGLLTLLWAAVIKEFVATIKQYPFQERMPCIFCAYSLHCNTVKYNGGDV